MKKKFIIPTIGIIETTDQPLLTNASIITGSHQTEGETPASTTTKFVVGAKESSFSLDF